MGMKRYVIVLDCVDEAAVRKAWELHCEQDAVKRRIAAIEYLTQEGVLQPTDRPGEDHFETAVYEYIIYDGAPSSFGESPVLHFISPPEWVNSIAQAEEWLLVAHKKWEPALAIRVGDKTVVGGWVSV